MLDIGKRNMIRFVQRLLCATLLTTCTPEARVDGDRGPLVVADVMLTVINHSPRPARISLESDTLDHHLGDVSSSASRSFSLPSSLAGASSPLRLKAVHDGAQAIRSDDFDVQHGQKVVWTFTGTGRGTVVKY